MLNKDIEEIIELNNEFYQKHSESFDRSKNITGKGLKMPLNTLKKVKKYLI